MFSLPGLIEKLQYFRLGLGREKKTNSSWITGKFSEVVSLGRYEQRWLSNLLMTA